MDHEEIMVRVSGDVDTPTTNDLRGILVNLIMIQRPSRIVVDLCAVTALDSSAVGMLRAARDVAEDVGRRLVFRTAGSLAAGHLDHDHVPTGQRLAADDHGAQAA
jgi:anti-anti-sigma factor